VVGLDGGGTKTAAVLMRQDGEVLARGKGGAANWNFVAEDTVRESVRTALVQVLQALAGGEGLMAIGGHVLAPLRMFADILDELCPNAPYYPLGEAAVAAVGIVGEEQPGVVVIAGTGSQASGFAGGETWFVGGWGSPLGDEGGAADIGWRALRAATRTYDGRIPPTSLLEAIYAHFGIDDLRAWMSRFYQDGIARHEIAALAPVVVRCADNGDGAARRILQEAGRELALAASTAARRARLSGTAFPVITAGAVFRGGAAILAPFQEALREVEPQAYLVASRFESDVGAALLTLAACGIPLDEEVLARAER